MSKQVVDDIRHIWMNRERGSAEPTAVYTLSNVPIAKGTNIVVKFAVLRFPDSGNIENWNDGTITAQYGTPIQNNAFVRYDGDRTFTFVVSNSTGAFRGESISYTAKSIVGIGEDKSTIEVGSERQIANTILSAVKKGVAEITGWTFPANTSRVILFYIDQSVDTILGWAGLSVTEIIDGQSDRCDDLAIVGMAVYRQNSFAKGKNTILFSVKNTSDRDIVTSSVKVSYTYLDL